MAGGGGDQETNLEYTPTWVVAVVSTVIVAISLLVERILHYGGKYLLKKKQKPLYEALQKIKEELMLLGFISLLLTVSQDRILKICISKHLTNHWLPCIKDNDAKETVHFLTNFFSLVPGGRCLLVGSANSGYCGAKDKAPLLSLTALHHLHTFIFVLAVSHVTLLALTILFGGLKQFFGSVTKLDYTTLRLGFIMIHCKGNPKFNFHKYMIRVLEADFKKVVGISWYLWLFVVLFLLLNVHGWHAYFWIAFIPFGIHLTELKALWTVYLSSLPHRV
ncbi:hypothetical protein P3S67_029592 [Capsicum chacoense]